MLGLIVIAMLMQSVHMIRLRDLELSFVNFFKTENIVLSIFYFLILSWAVYVYEGHNGEDD